MLVSPVEIIRKPVGVLRSLPNDHQVRFEVNPSSGRWPRTPEVFLYHQPEFLDLQVDGTPTSFALVQKSDGVIMGIIHFQIIGDKAYSGWSSPFGSLAGSVRSESQLILLLGYIEAEFSRLGIRKIEIKSPAFAYKSEVALVWHQALLSTGYEGQPPALNHHILIHPSPFAWQIHKMEYRKLLKCERAGMKAERVDPQHLPALYQFILQCRQERDQSLSMTLCQLEKSINALPHAYLLFQVTLQQVIIAAALVVRVNNRILYYFYPASSLDYQTYSPQVFLLDHIYEYAQEQGYKLLDLGSSLVDGQPKTSLQQFKKRVGGLVSHKYTYQKTLK